MRRNTRPSIWLCLLTLIAIGAGSIGTAVSAQTPTAPSDRLGWTQSLAASDLPNLSYALFVNGQRQSLPTYNCTQTATAGVYDCSAPLPALTPGPHRLELVAIVTINGVAYESPKSAALDITLIVIAAPAGLRIVRG